MSHPPRHPCHDPYTQLLILHKLLVPDNRNSHSEAILCLPSLSLATLSFHLSSSDSTLFASWPPPCLEHASFSYSPASNSSFVTWLKHHLSLTVGWAFSPVFYHITLTFFLLEPDPCTVHNILLVFYGYSGLHREGDLSQCLLNGIELFVSLLFKDSFRRFFYCIILFPTL